MRRCWNCGCTPGRQHQIRLHLEKLGHPLIGERVYSQAQTGRQVARPPGTRESQHAARVDARVSASAHGRARSPSKRRCRATSFATMKTARARCCLLALLAIAGVRADQRSRRRMAAARCRRCRRRRRSSIDGALDEEVWHTRRAGQRISSRPIRSKASRPPRSPKSASPTTPTTSTSPRSAATPIPSGIVVNEIRKDFAGRDQDTFEVLLDTFADRRNGFVFSTNCGRAPRPTRRSPTKAATSTPTGTRCGGSKRARTAEGWTAEFRIPFKTLRFEAGDGKSWGINFARRVRRKNEVSYWSPVSRAYSIFRASAAGNLDRPAARCGRAATSASSRFSRPARVRGVGERRLRSRSHRRRRPQGRHHAVADASTPRSIPTSRRPKPTSSKSTSRSSACSSRRSASSSSRTPASSTSATFPRNSATGRRGSVRPKKICCSSSAAASG